MALSEKTNAAADRIIARYPQPRSALMPLMYLIQAEQGYITEEGIAWCAQKIGLTKAEVQAVQTYYEMFEREPVGDWLITVCCNFSCKVRGGQAIYDRLVEILGGHHDHEAGVAVEDIICLGNCDDAPVVQINYQNYKKVSLERAEELLAACRRGEPPVCDTTGRVPETFREVSWRLSGADDGRVLHEGAVRGVEADMTSSEKPTTERVFEELKSLGDPGVHPPGTEVGDASRPEAGIERPDHLPDEALPLEQRAASPDREPQDAQLQEGHPLDARTHDAAESGEEKAAGSDRQAEEET